MSIPHRILEYPERIDFGIIEKEEKSMFKRIDDKIYLESHGHRLSVYSQFGWGAIVLALWFLSFGVEDKGYLTLSILLILGGGFLVFYSLYAKKNYKIFELNRLEGTVTYPDNFFRPPLKGKFKDLKAVISISGNIDGYVDTEYLKFVNTFKPRKIDLLYTFYGDEPRREWSFMVWYMDKNRPLPPGNTFDPYRQQDFERRKALGFPKPLYPSNVPTPEATPEQQEERKRIGGW
ncbi:hypothetical protein C7448_101774 [Tenacibaculum gallaicum]|uniref:Uncharacterized protein n=1 Tax=Tenacibaculum gallaicum TaxID=561505 RepID=A0A3E0IDM1_9FLAO|nr:hypothetical protein [Tenacibaculum gallaicum]REH56731.1 hypothetical protein C7448_101774 [Tenacibaculum gallaicum]